MTRSFKDDYAFGISSENEIKSVLEKHFDTMLVKCGQYDRFDYEGEVLVELKTRTNAYKKYPTTMIPTSKCTYAKKETKDVYFAFRFTDGLYYIQYDPALFETFGTDDFQRKDRIDHVDRRQSYTYIPIERLSKMV